MTDLQSPCAVVDDEVLGYVARERVLLSKDHVDLGGGRGNRSATMTGSFRVTSVVYVHYNSGGKKGNGRAV